MPKPKKTPLHGWTKAEKLAMFRKIWPNLSEKEFHEDDYSMLLEYIASEMMMLEKHRHIFAVGSLDETLDLLQDLKHIILISRDHALNIVKQRFPSGAPEDEAILRSIDLTIRLWLPLDIRSSGLDSSGIIVGSVLPQPTSVKWTSSVSLKELVEAQFVKHEPNRSSSRARINPALTIAYLVNTCGFRVYWTHNLADHLTIDWKIKVVTVYEHKICLWNHLKSTEESAVPKAVLEEAIDTLNLLFPFGDAPTRGFLSRQEKPFYSLGFCKRPRVLELEKYSYWQEKVEDLIDVFNMPPQGLQQLKLDKDRRNFMQFATFWIATVVAILTILSIAFGTVSTVYAVKQYKLALAQACSAPGAASQLPQFCP